MLWCRQEWAVHAMVLVLNNTANREYFVVKIFSDSLACAQLNARNNINNNVIQGHLSENLFNMKNYRMKYFRHEIFAMFTVFRQKTHYRIIINDITIESRVSTHSRVSAHVPHFKGPL